MKSIADYLAMIAKETEVLFTELYASVGRIAKRMLAKCKKETFPTVREPSSAKPQGMRSTYYPPNYGDIHFYRQHQMLNRVLEEIAMEKVHYEALEILSGKETN